MLDPRFTHAGIGVSLAASGTPALFVAEEFTVLSPALTPKQTAEAVLGRAAGHRASFGLPLEDAVPALHAAASLLADSAEPAEPGMLLARLPEALKAAGWNGTCEATVQVVSDPEDFVLPASVTGRDAVSLAAAGRPIPAESGGGRVLVVLLVAGP
jgi:hypothetical protein